MPGRLVPPPTRSRRPAFAVSLPAERASPNWMRSRGPSCSVWRCERVLWPAAMSISSRDRRVGRYTTILRRCPAPSYDDVLTTYPLASGVTARRPLRSRQRPHHRPTVQVQHADRVVFVGDVRDAYPSIDGHAPRVGHVHRAQHPPTPRVEDTQEAVAGDCPVAE